MGATAEVEISSLDLPHDVAALFFHQVKGQTARLVVVDEPDPMHAQDAYNGDELIERSIPRGLQPHIYTEAGGQAWGECEVCGHPRDVHLHKANGMLIHYFRWGSDDRVPVNLCVTCGEGRGAPQHRV